MQKSSTLISNFINSSEKVFLLGPIKDNTEMIDDFFFTHSKCPLIYIDGGLVNYSRAGLSIGDGDSASQECDVIFNQDKSFTDLEGALSLLPKGIKELHCAGFIGGRLDHQLVVFQNFMSFSHQRNCYIKHHGNNQIEVLPAGEHEVLINSNFSVLSAQKQVISITGECDYQVENVEISPFSGRGLSNIGHGLIRITCSSSICLFNLPTI